jgi:mutator family transposase
MLQDAAEDVPAYPHLSVEHRRQLHSTNPLERLNREIKRRCRRTKVGPNVEREIRKLVFQRAMGLASDGRSSVRGTSAALCAARKRVVIMRPGRERQGILAFAERLLPRAADLWVQASLNQKQRLQQLFLPEGIAFDGNQFNRTAATAPLFNSLAPSESAVVKMVSRVGIEPTTRRLRVCCSAN